MSAFKVGDVVKVVDRHNDSVGRIGVIYGVSTTANSILWVRFDGSQANKAGDDIGCFFERELKMNTDETPNHIYKVGDRVRVVRHRKEPDPDTRCFYKAQIGDVGTVEGTTDNKNPGFYLSRDNNISVRLDAYPTLTGMAPSYCFEPYQDVVFETGDTVFIKGPAYDGHHQKVGFIQSNPRNDVYSVRFEGSAIRDYKHTSLSRIHERTAEYLASGHKYRRESDAYDKKVQEATGKGNEILRDPRLFEFEEGDWVRIPGAPQYGGEYTHSVVENDGRITHWYKNNHGTYKSKNLEHGRPIPKDQATKQLAKLAVTTAAAARANFTNQKVPNTMALEPTKIENRVYVTHRGVDRLATELTDDNLFGMIQDAEAEIERLQKIKAQPKALQARIDSLQAGIDSLVKVLDERTSKDTSKKK